MDELDGSTVEPEVDESALTTDSAETEVAVETEVEPEPVEVEGSDVEVEAEDAEEDDSDFRSRLSEEDYAYVQSLREEAKTNRQRAERFESAFEGFDEADVDAFNNAVRLIQTDPAAAHGVFSNLVGALAEVAGISAEEAEQIVNDAVNEDVVVEDEEDDNDDVVLTRAELREFLAEQDAKKVAEAEAAAAAKAQADRDAEIKKEVDEQISALGYKEGTKGFYDLMYYANSLEEGSVADKLAKADELVKADRQAIIDSFLSDNQAQIDSVPPQSDGVAPLPSKDESYKRDIKSGAKAARAALDAMFGDESE